MSLGGVVIEIGGQRAETDAKGYYQLTSLTAGNYTLRANHDKYEFNTKDITIGKKHPSVHNIVSNGFAFYTIEGYVTDNKGEPLGSVVIEIGGLLSETDAKGYYQLNDLTAGNYTLVATHDKYEFNPQNLTVGKNHPSVIDIVSDSLAFYTIEGHLTDKNGQPMVSKAINRPVLSIPRIQKPVKSAPRL